MTHEDYMQLAIEQAKAAAARDEVPVGAVLIVEGEVFSGQGKLDRRYKQ